MLLKDTIKSVIGDLLGYKVLNKKYLPVGVEMESDILFKLCVYPKIVFDVGANIGQSAIRFHKAFPGASIYSFEPVKSTFTQLEKNTKNLPGISNFHCAFGSQQEEKNIFLFEDDLSQLNSLVDASMNHGSSRSEKICIDTIDHFTKTHSIDHIDLLKIDTEGYDLEVLYGAEQLLREKKVKLIYCETCFSAYDKHKVYFPEILQHLVERDYILLGFYEMAEFGNINKNIKGGTQYGNALFFLP